MYANVCTQTRPVVLPHDAAPADVPHTKSIARWHVLQAEAESLRHMKLQTCLALLSAAPDLQELSFVGVNLPVQHVSFVRMLPRLRKLHYQFVRPEPEATTASQLMEPLVRDLCSLEVLEVLFEGMEAEEFWLCATDFLQRALSDI
jgi:hypothetical protein